MDVKRDPERPAVRVEIGELRLEGVDPRLRFRIADAVEREIARLVAARDGAWSGAPRAPTERVDGGSVTFDQGAPAERIGAAIGQAVFRAMTAGRERDGAR